MKNLLSIGRFSQVTRLSIKTLRRYDQQGLLPAAVVDPETGYRYYRLSQALEAERIRCFRQLDLPLADIRQVLREPASEEAVLAAHRQRLQARIAEQQAALSRLQALMAAPAPRYTVQVQTFTESPAIRVRLQTDLATLPGQVGPTLGRLYRYAGLRLSRPAGAPFTVYHGEDFDPEDLTVDIGLPTARRLRGSRDVRSSPVTGGPAATTLHAGAYPDIGAAYGALLAWMQDNARVPIGAPREVYLVGPARGRDPADYRTEVVWPLEG